MVDFNRRELIALLPALSATAMLAGRAAAQQPAPQPAPLPPGATGAPDQAAFQADLAPFWDQLAMLPSVHAPATERPDLGICYMFTNKDCAVCQLVHKDYGRSFRRLEMRYILYPWPGEPVRELNYMYRPDVTLAEYDSYMDHKLTAVSRSDSSAQVDLVTAVAGEMAEKLVEGGAFGTPFFFHAGPGRAAGSTAFAAGDIVAMEPLLQRGA